MIPEGWYKILSEGKNSVFLNENKAEVAENNNATLAKYKDIHKGKRVFVLASGPSINTQDLTYLKDEHCIAVSQFFLHPDIKIIRPQYHCFAPQHSPFNDDTNKIIFDGFTKFYDFPIKAFIGNSDYKYSYKNYLQNNPNYNIDAEFVDLSRSQRLIDQNHMEEDVWNFAKKPFSLRTVIYLAIQLAYYMGFSEIYLLGVDHDYLKDTSRITDHHFYKDEKSFSDKEHLNMFTTERWFEEYYIRWKEYRLMKEFLESKNVKIFNATNGGMLDVFTTVKFESLFLK